MINQNNDADSSNSADSSDPSQPSFAGFSIGDWVEISEQAHEHNLTYVSVKGGELSRSWQRTNFSQSAIEGMA